MSITLRQEIHGRLKALKSERDASWMPHWQDLNRWTMPRVGRFLATDRNKGDRRNQKILNEAATFAINTAVRGLMYGITNPARPWLQLQTPYPELNRRQTVRIYLEELRDRMLEVFRRSNLYTVLPIVYRDLLIYGTNATALNKDRESVIRLEPLPLGSYCLATGGSLRVDTCFREYQRTRRQLVQRFGLEACSPEIQNAMQEKSNQETWEDVVHVVEPNPNHNPESPFAKDRAFRSIYFQPKAEEGKFLSVSGCGTFPILCPRWDVQDGDAYGFSPLMDVFGSAKGLQKFEGLAMELLEKVVRPPMNVPKGMEREPITQLPNGLNFVSGTEAATLQPAFQIHPSALNELTVWRQDYTDRINRALFVDIFLLLAGNQRDMTAAEVRARVEEKVQTLGPIMLRLNDELLDPLVERTFELMADVDFEGLMPEAPEELEDMPLTVEYVSDVHRAMKLTGVGAIEQTAYFVLDLAARQQAAGQAPTAADKLEVDETVDAYADLVGGPAKMVRDAEAVAAIRQARDEQMAQAQQMQDAQAQASVAKDLATEAGPDSLLAQLSGGDA